MLLRDWTLTSTSKAHLTPNHEKNATFSLHMTSRQKPRISCTKTFTLPNASRPNGCKKIQPLHNCRPSEIDVSRGRRKHESPAANFCAPAGFALREAAAGVFSDCHLPGGPSHDHLPTPDVSGSLRGRPAFVGLLFRTSRSGGLCAHASPAAPGRTPHDGPRPRLHLDWRVSALDRRRLQVGPRPLGAPPRPAPPLGRGTLGAQSPRMVLGGRVLALD